MKEYKFENEEEEMEFFDEINDDTMSGVNSPDNNQSISTPYHQSDPRIETLLSSLWEQAFSPNEDEKMDDSVKEEKVKRIFFFLKYKIFYLYLYMRF